MFIIKGGECSGPRLSWRRYLDDRCDEFFEEAMFEKTGPVVVDEVDEQPFDMRSVLILQV